MPTVTLCLIAKNEERFLPDCLASVRGVVDEIVVVDTGSTDRTGKIARKAGAKLIEAPWTDDFAAARNAALSRATGDFILQLDADERLASGAGPVLRAAATGSFDCGMLRLHDAALVDAKVEDVLSGRARLGDPCYLPRFLRRTPDLAWEGIIHEEVSAWVVRRGSQLAFLDVDIIHLGRAPEVVAAKKKTQRNIILLQRRCADERDDFTPFAYLAADLAIDGAVDAAWAAAEEGFRLLRARKAPRYRSALRLAVARTTLQFDRGDSEGALTTIAACEQHDGAHPDYDILRGCAHEKLALRSTGAHRSRRLRDALASHLHATTLAGRPWIQQYVAGGATWTAWTRAGTVLLAHGEAEEARTAFERALAFRADHVEAQLGLAEALVELGQPSEALALLEPIMDDQPDGWVLAAAATDALGALDASAALLDGARARVKKGYLSPYRRARHLGLAAARSAYRGIPVCADGPLGTLHALMGREPLPANASPADATQVHRALAPLVPNLLLSGHATLLEPLFEARAEAIAPGISRELRRLIEKAGAQVEDDGAVAPIFLLGDGDPSELRMVHALIAAHPHCTVRRLPEAPVPPSLALPFSVEDKRVVTIGARFSDADRLKQAIAEARFVVVTRGGMTPDPWRFVLDMRRLIGKPSETLARLTAFLGVADSDAPLRRWIEMYPGAASLAAASPQQLAEPQPSQASV